MPEIMIAARSGNLRVDGHLYRLRRGRTTAHSTHPAVVAVPGAWTSLRVDLPDPGQPAESEAIDPDIGGQPDPADVEPDHADRAAVRAAVRAWAAEQGIEVSPRGKIPQAVVDRYLAAQRES